MIKNFLLIYLLIGFVGYTFFEKKECEIIDIVSISGEVNQDVEEELTKNIIKANVMINSYTYKNVFEKINQVGSGVIVREDKSNYYILTNAHVVSYRDGTGSFSYQILDYQRKVHKASLVKLDKDNDLALLKMKKDKELKVIDLSIEDAKSEETIYAIGNPQSIINWITVGEVITYVDIPYANYPVINHSAPIDSGNSGGMLINTKYQLIGLNTWGYYNNDGSFLSSLAIPINIIVKFLN